MAKFLLIPLVILTFCSIFSYVFYDDTFVSVRPADWGRGTVGIDAAHNATVLPSGQEEIKYWDYNRVTNLSHPLVYKNGTLFGEAGRLETATGIEGAVLGGCYWVWRNTTTIIPLTGEVRINSYPYYAVYDNPSGLDESGVEVAGRLAEKGGLPSGSLNYGWFAGGQFGVLAVMFAFISISALAGLHVFGTGTSELGVGAIAKGGTLMSVFLVLSAGSYNMLTSIPIFGWLVYLLLSCVYTLGIINSVGGGGVD